MFHPGEVTTAPEWMPPRGHPHDLYGRPWGAPAPSGRADGETGLPPPSSGRVISVDSHDFSLISSWQCVTAGV